MTAYEPPLAPVGGYPAAAKHTEGEERANAEATLFAPPSMMNSAIGQPRPTCASPKVLPDA